MLIGCSTPKAPAENNKTPLSQVTSEQQTIQKADEKPEENKGTQAYLFEAKGMESIQLTGKEIIDGKEATMSVKISDAINMDFHIGLDHPNGMQLYAIYDSNACNLAVNYTNPEMYDNDEPIPAFSYQICCYDFNYDGKKEIVVAGGNHEDQLFVYVHYVDIDSEYIVYPENYILGYKNAYVNENNEIAVPSPNGVKTYRYNIKAEDVEYAKLSGPTKVSVDYATPEELQQHKTAERFVKDEGAPSLIIALQEKLKNVTICSIDYNPDTDKHSIVQELYSTTALTPENPLIFQAYLPDLPAYAISYTDEAGTEQVCGINESLQDGTIYLFEMGIARG
jgi:hypothetical protein